ncbi:MAG: nucleotide exchange factor GrpE, partial [Chlorobiota bacterium]
PSPDSRVPSEMADKVHQTSNVPSKVHQTYPQHEEVDAETSLTSHPEDSMATPPATAEAESPSVEPQPEVEAATLRQQYEELYNRYVHLVADFDNYRKRVLREREAWAEAATVHLLQQLLPIVDQLQMALQAESSSTESLRRGVELVYRNLERLLEQLGVKPIVVSPGQPFDVYYHEAVLHVPSELPEGSIVEELQRGYLFRDRILRHARVAVSAGRPQDDRAQPSADPSTPPEAS